MRRSNLQSTLLTALRLTALLTCLSACNSTGNSQEIIPDETPGHVQMNQPTNRHQSKNHNVYHLVDTQTQMPILSYSYPTGWMTGGKAEWIRNNPAVPHSWATWAVSPDGQQKFIISSDVQLMRQGRILEDPLLNSNEQIAAQFFVQAAQQDYNLSNIRITNASFENDVNAAAKAQKIAQQMAAQGLRATDIRCVFYSATLSGTREGKNYFVTYLSTMNVIEMQPAYQFTHLIEFTQFASYGGPVGTESQVEKLLKSSFQTLDFNQNFNQLKFRIAQMQTQQAIAETNRQYEIIRQRHRQNMADMDARAEARQRESDRKHAQVMGGGYGSSSGSMLDKWDEYIKDVDLVQNPNGGEIFIDNQRDHAWINSDNEIMYMDSPSFNPNENAAFNNREWKRIR